jgi:hypothetical protein
MRRHRLILIALIIAALVLALLGVVLDATGRVRSLGRIAISR